MCLSQAERTPSGQGAAMQAVGASPLITSTRPEGKVIWSWQAVGKGMAGPGDQAPVAGCHTSVELTATISGQGGCGLGTAQAGVYAAGLKPSPPVTSTFPAPHNPQKKSFLRTQFPSTNWGFRASFRVVP